MVKKYILFSFFLVLFAGWALAKLPPISLDEATRQSNVIVDGEVVGLEAASSKSEDDCGSSQDFIATVKIQKVLKGNYQNSLKLYYTKRVLNDECTGHEYLGYFLNEKTRFHLFCKDPDHCSRVYEGAIEMPVNKAN